MLLWFVNDAPELPPQVKTMVEDSATDVRSSIASFWEIGINASIGKLPLANSILGLGLIAEDQAIQIAPVTVQAVHHITQMPWHPKDPFDRIIAATATTVADVLVSIDPVFDLYGVRRQWKEA